MLHLVFTVAFLIATAHKDAAHTTVRLLPATTKNQ